MISAIFKFIKWIFGIIIETLIEGGEMLNKKTRTLKEKIARPKVKKEKPKKLCCPKTKKKEMIEKIFNTTDNDKLTPLLDSALSNLGMPISNNGYEVLMYEDNKDGLVCVVRLPIKEK